MASLCTAQADDQISLKNGDLFFGKVIALQGGLIELQTPDTHTPANIRNNEQSQPDDTKPPTAKPP